MISIVLPSYNGEKYIRESIDSILSQTFIDWELIIVNDCSTDGTARIIEEYMLKDKRIKCIHNEMNLKLPNSLNVGFSHAKGELLTWTSDDNIYLPTALEEMYSYLSQHENLPMVVGGVEYIDENGKVIGKAPKYDNNEIFLNNTVEACFLYRHEVIKDIGEYDNKMIYIEDFDYWLRIRDFYGAIGYIPKILYQYRHHSKSLTATKRTIINQQYLRLIARYFVKAVTASKKNKKFIFYLYMDYMEEKCFDVISRDAFVAALPELKFEVQSIENYDLILFGAGEFGDRVGKNFREQLLAYIDNDKSKINKNLNGVQILDLDTAMEKFSDAVILITVQKKYLYEIIQQLANSNVKRFAVYQNLVLD